MYQLTESLTAEPVQALQNRLASDGYLFFRSLLPFEVMQPIADELRRVFHEGGWLDASGAAVPGVASQARQETDPTYRAAALSESLNQIPYLDVLHSVVERVLGEPSFSYPSKVLRATPPSAWLTESGRYTHQDYVYWQVEDMVTTWIPLMDIPRSLGGLAVNPGSHLGPPVQLTVLDPESADWATTDYRLGDVILFHCLTAHAALPNQTDGLRLSGDFRWQAVTSPVKREFLYGVRNREDELLARSFSGKPWWRPIPQGLNIIEGAWGQSSPPNRSRFFPVAPEWASWEGPDA